MNEMSKVHVKRLEKELAEMTRDRDSWKRRAQYLEAKRVEGLQPPYKFGGEGVA